MSKITKPQSNDDILFDKMKIYDSLENNGIYKDDKNSFKYWSDAEDNVMYIAKINEDDVNFLGVLNVDFEREGYCKNVYKNGDIYFGYYSKNKRDKHGLYQFNSEIIDDEKLTEFYFGFWNNDLRDNHGVFLWLREPENNKMFSNFQESNFDAYVGLVKDDNFLKGTYLSKEEDDYYVYHGTFNEDNEKEGENCFLYSSSLEQLFFGKFENDNFVEGFVAVYDKDGNVKDILKYKDGKKIEEEKIDKKEIEKLAGMFFLFRNIIMNKDYFGLIYNAFKKIVDFRDTKMNRLENLNTDYLAIMTECFNYNKITIFDDIEDYVYYEKKDEEDEEEKEENEEKEEKEEKKEKKDKKEKEEKEEEEKEEEEEEEEK